jgi:Cullin family
MQGSVTVKSTLPKGVKDLILHPFQAAMLDLFNDAPELSLVDMMERLNLPEEEVARTVSSLAQAKHQILKRKESGEKGDKGQKGEEGKEKVKDDKKRKPVKADVYLVNEAWTDKLRRCSARLHSMWSTVWSIRPLRRCVYAVGCMAAPTRGDHTGDGTCAGSRCRCRLRRTRRRWWRRCRRTASTRSTRRLCAS